MMRIFFRKRSLYEDFKITKQDIELVEIATRKITMH